MKETAMSDMANVPAPGYFIREELEARGWSQRDLAYILDTPEQAVNLILAGKRGISPEMAKALGEAFDVNPEFFANLQKIYDMSRAREPDPGVARRARLQSAYPVREMIRRGWLEDTDAAMLEAQMARFFEVPTAAEIPHIAHAAKKANYGAVPPAQLAWLFRVRHLAKSLATVPYSERALRGSLDILRQLMVDPAEAQRASPILASCGVRFVVVECLPNAKIDGACLWLDSQSPVIGMSLRYDRIDNFWFVFRHEIEHVLRRHGMDEGIIDVELEGDRAGLKNVSEEERMANAAAADFCVPEQEIASFVARKNPFFSERDVLAFSRRMQVHPGIVVGQVQRRTERWDLLRKYLVKIREHVILGTMADGWGQRLPAAM
jgi:HTH-type transcriptional regulator / antitoxin HigA